MALSGRTAVSSSWSFKSSAGSSVVQISFTSERRMISWTDSSWSCWLHFSKISMALSPLKGSVMPKYR